MTTIRSVCVYCGARAPQTPAHLHAATQLGELLAVNNITLVYGGARIGMMGVPSTTSTVQKLVEIGVLKEMTGKSRNRIFAYEAYLEILAAGTEPIQ